MEQPDPDSVIWLSAKDAMALIVEEVGSFSEKVESSGPDLDPFLLFGRPGRVRLPLGPAPTVIVMQFDAGDDGQVGDPGERRQRQRRADNEHNAVPIPVTYRQVRLIANLIDAAADGHDLAEALKDVSTFLWLSSIQATLGSGPARIRGVSDPVEAWGRVESWPIPPPGPPRAQSE